MTIKEIDFQSIDLSRDYEPTNLQFELPPGSVTVAEALTLVYAWDLSPIPEELIRHFEQNLKRYPQEFERKALLQVLQTYNHDVTHSKRRYTAYLQYDQQRLFEALLLAQNVTPENMTDKIIALTTAGSDAFLQHHIYDTQQ